VSLRQQAELDLEQTLEDPSDFGWPITVTNPAGASSTGINGRSSDIGFLIDPDTGQAVTGRRATVTIRTKRLIDQGLGTPKNEPDVMVKPWLIEFDDIHGTGPHKFAVHRAFPDAALGVITCWVGTSSGY